jgi:hypothetical protein
MAWFERRLNDLEKKFASFQSKMPIVKKKQ